MLKYRLLTACILIPFFIFSLFYFSIKEFAVLTGIILLGATWEFSRLAGIQRFIDRFLYLVCIIFLTVFLVYLIFYRECFSLVTVLGITALWWLFASYLVIVYPAAGFLTSSRWIRAVMGILVLVPTWISVNVIYAMPQGAICLLYLFVLVWGADTSAYFTGKWLGKRKLLPHVSPQKTVAGFFGALVMTLIIASMGPFFIQMPVTVGPLGFLIAFITVLFSMVGDFFESLLKRREHLKDSGRLLPGHGGLLDRIDSLTAAAPLFLLSMIIVQHFLR